MKYTLDLVQSSIRFREYWSWLESVEILNEREIAFRLGSELTLSNFIPLGWFPIMPAHYWEDKDPTRVALEPPLGSGPYRIAEVRQGRHILYERVPDYWGRDIPVNRGRFNFDQIRYDVNRDATVAREAFRKGLIDAWIEPDIRYWATGYDIPAREKGWLVMGQIDNRGEVGINRVIALNNRRERFKDPRVREALTLAVDFEWQNRVLHFGLLERALSYFSGEPSLEARGLPGRGELALLEPFRNQLPRRLFTEAFELPRSTGRGRNRASLERARALLAQAGWQIKDGVLANSTGEPFEVEFLSANVADQRTLLPYLSSLKLLGIAGRIRLVDDRFVVQDEVAVRRPTGEGTSRQSPDSVHSASRPGAGKSA
ncbi:MAG: ABC transporter substrate-binding protein [Gammaproteobacteria bacterium]|nr:ABC transporter substrate-binding protein [Gammaproteobacteria bacterium]